MKPLTCVHCNASIPYPDGHIVDEEWWCEACWQVAQPEEYKRSLDESGGRYGSTRNKRST